MPKRAPQQFKCVENEHFKTTCLQTIYNAKCTFTQKQIPKMKNLPWFQRKKFLYSMYKILGLLFESFPRAS